MIYERDFMKHTMLEHDAVFKNQVHELHRLYRVQRNLVDEVKGNNSNDDASKRHFPGYGEGSSSQACNGPLQNRRKMIDLELPADEFDETGDTDEITTRIPHKRPRSGREDGSHRSNSSGSCLDVKNSNGLADLNEPLNWQDSEPVAALSRDVYPHYGRSNADVSGRLLEKNTSQNGRMVLGSGHDRSTQRDLHLPSHSVQVRSNSAVQPQSYLTTDHSNVVFSRERAYHELEVRSNNPQASHNSYVESYATSNAPRLHNDYRPDYVRPLSHWSSSWENPRSTSHQRFYPVQTNPYMNFVARARTDTSFDTRTPVTNGVYHGFSSGSKEAAVSFPSGGFRPNASLGEVMRHQSSESFQGLKTQESSANLPWLKPKPSYKSERSNGFFDLNASTDQFMDGTDTGDCRNGVSPQTGFRSSASCSYNANMGRIEMINPQNSGKLIGCPIFEKPSVCKEERAPLISRSADQHKEVKHMVKRDFDINLPCDASDSVDQRGSKAFCAVKEEGNKAANNRHYFDLNSCASEGDEDSGFHSSLRVKTKGNIWIDLEAPPALESEEEGGGSQDMKDQDDNPLDELIKEAAQAIVAISLSDHPHERRTKMTTMQTLCFITLFIAIFTSQTTSAYRFKFNHFGNSTDLFSFHGDAEYGHDTDGTTRSGSLSLTKDKTPFSHGRAILINPIIFKPPNNASSVYPFKTSFTFSITPHNTNPAPGHGFAFLVVPSNQHAGSGLGFLSLVNRTSNGNPSNHLFAVEFDVFQDKSFKDINDNHVGIDINSVDSVTSVKSGYWVMTRNGWLFKDLKLNSGDKYTAWIEYNNNLKVISVTIGFAHLKKPNRPLIEAKYDLSNVLLEKMYAGFAGSMGRGVERHEIWDWTFQN